MSGSAPFREVPREMLVAFDSHLSWCRHRHRNPPDVEREIDELILYLRRGDSESEAERINRVMREVLTKHLAKLNEDAVGQGWT